MASRIRENSRIYQREDSSLSSFVLSFVSSRAAYCVLLRAIPSLEVFEKRFMSFYLQADTLNVRY